MVEGTERLAESSLKMTDKKKAFGDTVKYLAEQGASFFPACSRGTRPIPLAFRAEALLLRYRVLLALILSLFAAQGYLTTLLRSRVSSCRLPRFLPTSLATC